MRPDEALVAIEAILSQMADLELLVDDDRSVNQLAIIATLLNSMQFDLASQVGPTAEWEEFMIPPHGVSQQFTDWMFYWAGYFRLAREEGRGITLFGVVEGGKDE